MDWVSMKERGWESLKKYRYVLLAVLAGLFLMVVPEKKKEPEYRVAAVSAEPRLQDSLSEILSKISGAGKVEVLLTEAKGEQMLYQMDEDRTVGENNTDIRRKTVLVTDSGRNETGLLRQIDPPTYQGAVVLCQGADNAKIALAIVEAVADATGLSADKITVLKMK